MGRLLIIRLTLAVGESFFKFQNTPLVCRVITVGSLASCTWVYRFPACITVQFSHSVVSNSLQPHGLQHTRLPCPSPTPRACSNSCPASWWYHPAETVYLRLGREPPWLGLKPAKTHFGTWTHVAGIRNQPKPCLGLETAKTHGTWFQDIMKLRFFMSHHRKNSVRDKVIG